MSEICIALTFDFDGMSNWIANGATSPSMVSRGEFGPIGLLRILDLLDRHDLPGTFFVPGHTALAFPDHCREIAAAGHEIGHHGWVHENPVRLTPEQERDVLQRGLTVLEETTGTRPVGYRSPAWDISPATIPLLIEHGFLYDSSLMGDDFSPYWARVGDRWTQDGPYV
ncbi:polysaccharide deacetylase family protein [Chachezhania antarctica]|uniref:polysaccharide deacetylase family protein n=1 Tax=Chachezhania antarctica TaxID=2340860 RepID=UPI0013CE8708|nr:polysaccharide deacetylase family protein [Chachezhania antarctica]